MSEPAPEEFISLTEFKNFLKVTSADDDQVRDVLDATLEHVATRVVVSLGTDVATVRVRASRDALLLPVSGAAELVQVTDPTGAPVSARGLDDVDVDAGIITLAGPARAGTYEVQVRFPGAAADVKLACLHIGKHLWSIHRGSQGGARSDAEAQGDLLQGFAIPRRAQELLAPYARLGGFA